MLWTVAAGVTFEAAGVFYNAMLPDLAPTDRIGRASGWAWGLGYAGGLCALLAALWLMSAPAAALFGLDAATQEPVRATAVLTAVWFGLFALPLFVLVPDRPATGVPLTRAVAAGVASLRGVLARLPRHGGLGRFLLAHMFYADALTTLFAFGGVYAAGTFGMTTEQIIWFGIALNVAAGAGAAAFAWFDDRFGAKPTIMLALAALTVASSAMLAVTSIGAFWALAVVVGVFVGPAQAASRSFMARIAPPGLEVETFGLYALSGKATAFAGPWLVATLTGASSSQRIGMIAVPGFLIIGLVLLLGVPAETERSRALPPDSQK
jgi:UMF1 family MFS transporter